jgi:hypothetical protein
VPLVDRDLPGTTVGTWATRPVIADRKTYPMRIYDWVKVEMALNAELAALTKSPDLVL